ARVSAAPTASSRDGCIFPGAVIQEQTPTAACDCGPESARQREWRPAAAQRMASLCALRPPGTFCGTVPPLFPEVNMLSDELRVQIRHWFYAEHWRVGTIAQQLGVCHRSSESVFS